MFDAEVDFGENVRRVRKRAGLTQEHLASVSGIHVSYISGVETGKRNPTLRVILTLSSALGVKPADLFESKCEKEK